MARMLKLSPLERRILTKIKRRKVKNIERPIRIGGVTATHPRSGKPLTASYVNISNREASQFDRLRKKGLISSFGKIPYFSNFRLTEKGEAQYSGKRRQ